MAKKTDEPEPRWKTYTPTEEEVMRAYLSGHPERTRAEFVRFMRQVRADSVLTFLGEDDRVEA